MKAPQRNHPLKMSKGLLKNNAEVLIEITGHNDQDLKN